MTKIDYRRVIDLMARTLKLDRNVEVTNPEKEFNIFAVVMTGINDEWKKCKVILHDFSLDLIFEKKFFTERDFEKFASNFEYELEQTFFKNIS